MNDSVPFTIDRRELARVAFVALAAAIDWFRLWEPIPSFDSVGVAATLVGGYPIFREAFENVRARRMTMELSMTIALVAALAIGQAFTALVITAFVLVAEILEHLTISRGRAAIGDLLAFLPQTALVRRGATVVEIRAERLVVGDVVLVNPGAAIPVDGIVLAGHSFVDEARITGESMPVEKGVAARIYAGTINASGVLEIAAERLGRDTSFGRIVDAVESADRARAPVERLADRLAVYLVSFALGAAALTFAITRDAVATISVIIVAGACGVAAGTPLAVLGAIGRAARAGAIVKGGRYLEALAATQTVAFDKTGTLTMGKPEIVRVEPLDGSTFGELVGVAASAEMRSEHPIGRAIVAYANARKIEYAEPTDFVYRPGRGITAYHEGERLYVGSAALLRENGIAYEPSLPRDDAATEIVVARGDRVLGTIAIADTVRPEAFDAIAKLHRMGIRVVMLTGDGAAVARSVGTRLALDDVVAECLPEGKRAYIARRVATGEIVVMVGDGINDAPALIAATVGVAMGSGTDVARESADVVLLGNDLGRFVETLEIARRTKTIVMQNFIGTLAVDAIGIGLAAVGILSPLLAAIVHVGSELAFILNATRMLVPPAPSPQPNRVRARTSRYGKPARRRSA